MRTCPRCEAPSRVLEIRVVESPYGTTLRRRRTCERECGWRLSTVELPAPLVAGVHDPLLVSGALLREAFDTLAVLLERQLFVEEGDA